MVSSATVPSASEGTADELPATEPLSSAARPEVEKSVFPSPRARLITAGFFVFFSILIIFASSLTPGLQPRKLVALVCVSISGLAVLVEVINFFRLLRHGPSSPFLALPLLGAGAVCVAGALAALSEQDSLLSPLATAAPAWAVAAMLLGNAFFAQGIRLGRRDRNYLYPTSFKGPVETTNLGGVVECTAGDVLAMDGRIQRGCLALDERLFSPVSEFRIREEEEVTYAGSEILAGSATVVALTTPSDAALGQLQQVLTPIIEESQNDLQKEDLRAARWSSLGIVFLSAAAGIFWHERSPGYDQALLAFGTVALFGSVCLISSFLYGARRDLVQRWVQRGYLLAQPDSCKRLASVTDVSSDPSRCGEGSLLETQSLEVLDDRLSPIALSDFLCAILGRAEDPALLSAAEYCRRHATAPSAERVVDLREYRGRGICGTVHGVELSIGSEDFLVERGIMVQPSDGSAPQVDGRVLLVAIDDDVVARLHVSTCQSSLVPTDGVGEWVGGVHVALSSGVAKELGDQTLLIRGRESDLIGQIAANEMVFFDANEAVIRRSTIVSFTSRIAPLPLLLRDCRIHIRAIERSRLLVGCSGLMVLVATFAGAVTPVIPLLLVASVGLLVSRSHKSS